MKKILSISAALLLIFLTSCFEITEKASFNKDGSGHMELIINLQKLKSMLAMLESLGKQAEERKFDSQDPLISAINEFEPVKERLAAIAGLSNVTLVKDTVNYSAGYSFDFAHTEALNKAMNIIFTSKESEVSENTFFEFSRRILVRSSILQFDDMIKQDLNAESEDINNFKFLFEDMSYTMEYTFPKKVKRVSNPQSSLSPDNKTVSLTYYLYRENTNGNIAGNVIKF